MSCTVELSQEGKPQTHCGTLRVVHVNTSLDFSQQDYQLRSATEVHVGPLRASIL